MLGSILPAVTKAPSKILRKAMKGTNSRYQLAYFNFHGRAESIRYLLAYAGVPWKEIVFKHPTDAEWLRHKVKTPYKCLPVLYETTESGIVLELSEVLPIERYLARNFKLHGTDRWERFQVEQAVSSIDTSQVLYHHKVLLPNWPSNSDSRDRKTQKQERRVEEANRFYEMGLKSFVDVHEARLKANGGGNGYYAGTKPTLADLRATLFMDRLLLLRPEGANPIPLSKKKSPNLWKVRDSVHQIPAIAKWRESERFQELDALTEKYFGFKGHEADDLSRDTLKRQK
ncbi:hypothetical protein BGW39_003923 [Mortierella sp. 14UC]|nr:hypothetical protein BGW39_003923 [Mortierella sp. 14UC]